MAIKASSRTHVDALVRDLASDGARESALARLTLIGARAVGRLMALVEDAAGGSRTVPARTAALRALEAIGDQRALDVAARAIEDPDQGIATAAAGVVRLFLKGSRSAAAVETLTRVAVDRGRPDTIRLAALAALCDLDTPTLKPLFKALEDDPSEAMRGAVRDARQAAVERRDDTGRLRAAAKSTTLEEPDALLERIVETGDRVPLPRLRDLIERIREREPAEPPTRRAQWMVARAAAHAALARRGSRLALYDIRETLESAPGPLPVEFLTALALVGDTSCLESIAGAYARTVRAAPKGDDWWGRHLADVFTMIVARDRVTRRHPVMKKILKRWPEVIDSR